MRHGGQHSQFGPAGRLGGIRHDRDCRAPQHGRAQDKAGNARLDRLCAPRGHLGIGSDDEQTHRATVDGARAHRVLGPGETFARIDAELDFDDEHRDGDVADEQEDNDISAVLGGLNLRQINRDDARLGVGRERDAERFGEELGAERGAVLEEINARPVWRSKNVFTAA